MKVLEFTSRDIIVQLSARFLLVLLTGILGGIALTYAMREELTGAVLASFGTPPFQFVTHPLQRNRLYTPSMGAYSLLRCQQLVSRPAKNRIKVG